MVVRNLIGGIFFSVIWLGTSMVGIGVFGSLGGLLPTQPVKAEIVCGIETEDFGSGVVSCDDSLTSWVSADSNTHIYKDNLMTRTTTYFDSGVVSEVSVFSDGAISAYVG